MEEEWITVKEAARKLSVSERNVRFKISSGKLKAKREGRRWLVHSSLSPDVSDKDKQIAKLQEEVSQASERSDTIILQLTRQLEQSQRLLKYHQEPWYRRVFGRKSSNQNEE